MTRLVAVAAWLATALACAPVGPGSDRCRFEPERCGGGFGGFCDDDRDCGYGLECCEADHCGGGTCTAECRSDGDCPADMRCEHDVCLYACDDDRDCAPGMSCEHGETVCEW